MQISDSRRKALAFQKQAEALSNDKTAPVTSEQFLLWNQARLADPTYWRPLNACALYYRDQKDYDTAKSYQEKALQLAPEKYKGKVLHNTGTILYDQGKYAEALSYFQKALKLFPKNADHHYMVGGTLYCLNGLQSNQEIINYWIRAAELDQKYLTNFHIKTHIPKDVFERLTKKAAGKIVKVPALPLLTAGALLLTGYTMGCHSGAIQLKKDNNAIQN